MIHETLTAHMDWLFRQALRLCGSTDDAQELTQETLLSALLSPAEPEDPEAWLATILRRRHADMLRRKYRRPTVCIDCVPEPPAPIPDDAEREAEEAIVRREVAFLAGRYREAIIRHYLHGEKVADVAAALGIPAGTVLSRLHAGRQQMRKGMTHMEEYGQQSYQPERLDVSCHGRPGLHDEPFSLVGDDLLRQNILITAYQQPLTPVEIARHMGVPTAYIEPAVEALVRSELMRALPGGKVATDFLITTPAQREAGISTLLEMIHRHSFDVTAPSFHLRQALEKLPVWARLTPFSRDALRDYLVLHLFDAAVYNAVRRIFPGEEVFPDRPDGGRWIADGFRVPMDYDWTSSTFRHYTYGGERVDSWENYMGAKSITLRIYDAQPDLNRYQHGPVDMDDATLCRLLYILHKGLPLADTGIDPALMQNLPHLVECGVLRRTSGRPECAIPVITRAEYGEIDTLRRNYVPDAVEVLEPLLRQLAPKLCVSIPDHLCGRVAEFRRFSVGTLPMILLMEDRDRHLITQPPVTPPMVLVVDE